MRTKIKVQSSGSVTASGLQPDKLDYGRLDDASKNVSAAFDWSASELNLTYDGKTKRCRWCPASRTASR